MNIIYHPNKNSICVTRTTLRKYAIDTYIYIYMTDR